VNDYEVVYIIKPEVEEDAISELVKKYSDLVANNDGEVVNVDEWGKRKLAYEIMKYNEGYYVLMEFKSSSDFVKELERLLRIDEKILKFLVTRKEQ